MLRIRVYVIHASVDVHLGSSAFHRLEMPALSLAALCHKALLSQELRKDAHVTLETYITELQSRFVGKNLAVHFETVEDLCVRQATDQFWAMSQEKLRVMSFECKKHKIDYRCQSCGRRPTNNIARFFTGEEMVGWSFCDDAKVLVCADCFPANQAFKDTEFGKVFQRRRPWNQACSARSQPYWAKTMLRVEDDIPPYRL